MHLRMLKHLMRVNIGSIYPPVAGSLTARRVGFFPNHPLSNGHHGPIPKPRMLPADIVRLIIIHSFTRLP